MREYLRVFYLLLLFSPQMRVVAESVSTNAPLSEQLLEGTSLSQIDVHVKQRDWDQVINVCDQALQHDANDALAYEYRGCAFFLKGRLDEAVKDLSEAIRIDSAHVRFYLNRANAYIVLEDMEKALGDLGECVRLDPTNCTALRTRATVYSKQGDFKNAIEDWDQLLEFQPQNSVAIATRGFAKFSIGNFEEAVLDYNSAIKIDTTNDLACNNLAWLRATASSEEMRDGKEAVSLARKACELTDWKQWQWIDTLAAAYAEEGDFEKAVAFQRQAMNMTGFDLTDLLEMQHRLRLYLKREPYRAKVGK